jgi:hypothetical protein
MKATTLVPFLVATASALADTVSFDVAKTGPLPDHSLGTQTGSGPAKFVVTFDGKEVIKATDESFEDAGKVGAWTKADSLTLFDDFLRRK